MMRRIIMGMKRKKKDVVTVKKIGHGGLLNLSQVRKEAEAIETEMTEMGSSSSGDIYRGNAPVWQEGSMVGFESEAMSIKDQLTGGPQQLEVVSIVGMAGLGKTTLATNVFNDSYIAYYFHMRASILVSQEFRKRDSLLGLLSSLMPHVNGIDRMSEEKLGEKVYKSLKGKRYLILLDDIWETSAWDDLKSYFPNDHNGSRIMLTSRHANVALHAQPSNPPLSLRFLNEEESWDLFQQKIFRRENCPPELMEIGKHIAIKCLGLPLAIVVVAGILANEKKSQERWKQVAETMKSSVVGDPRLWMETVALSYNRLPNHLKPCFLYFGAFPDDFQVPVWKLIWLWIAEGFVRSTGGKRLEDAAEEYLMDLIGRSLVLVSTRGYDGGIKACGIHDLLRDFCLKKAEEEYFLLRISGNQHLSSPSERLLCMHRLSIYDSPSLWAVTSKIDSAAKTHSFLFFKSGWTPWNAKIFPPNFSPKWFNRLTLLDMSSVDFTRYPSEVERLVLLRYLSLCIYSLNSETYLPSSISNLSNLETLILGTHTLLPCAVQLMNLSLTREELHKFVGTSSSVTLPNTIREMAKLRHIRLTGHGIHKIERQDLHSHHPFLLGNLQTLSWVNPWSCQDFLAGTPSIRKLGFRGQLIIGGCLSFPNLDFLTHLQELKLFNTGSKELGWLSNNIGKVKFPVSLKKLTLKKTYVKWDELSALGKLLPNLESLKLLVHACSGECWETSDGSFPQLKFLKLESLEIVQWEVYSSHFPRLQRVELIAVHWCSLSLADSAREIKQEQESAGNKWLQITESNNIATSEMLKVV